MKLINWIEINTVSDNSGALSFLGMNIIVTEAMPDDLIGLVSSDDREGKKRFSVIRIAPDNRRELEC